MAATINLTPFLNSPRLRLHEQIKPSLIAPILDSYEVTPDEFAQIRKVYFICSCKRCLNLENDLKDKLNSFHVFYFDIYYIIKNKAAEWKLLWK